METANIHASCVVLGRAGPPFGAPENTGVLLLGESGTGKSDLALRLIALGAELVADDRTELFVRGGLLMAGAPASLAGLMEVRGLGIVALPCTKDARIGLAVAPVEMGNVPRHPQKEFYTPPEALNLPVSARPPMIWLAPLEASAPAKVALAAAAFAKALFRDQSNRE